MKGSTAGQAGIVCVTCGKATRNDRVNVAMWLGSELNVIEDVPAQVCDNCHTEYFDPDTDDKMQKLAASGFPRQRAKREIAVPVFSLDSAEAFPALRPELVREDVTH